MTAIQEPAKPAAPDREPAAATVSGYAATYLAMRIVIGGCAAILPVALIAVDWHLITDTQFMVDNRGLRTSMSAYYHSAARDLLVAGLCVIGVLLLTYLIGQRQRAANLVSSLAGLAVIVVAIFPTWRDPERRGPFCDGEKPSLPGCTPLQNTLGESFVGWIHVGAASVFVICLFVLSVMFIRDEAQRLSEEAGGEEVLRWTDVPRYLRRGRNPWYALGALMIVGATGVLVVGQPLVMAGVRLEPVYLSELLVFIGFATSWILVGFDALRVIKAGAVHG